MLLMKLQVSTKVLLTQFLTVFILVSRSGHTKRKKQSRNHQIVELDACIIDPYNASRQPKLQF